MEQLGNLPVQSSFAPVIEKNSTQPFLDKDPYWLLKNGDVADVPWIASHTADEGLLSTAAYWSDLESINKQWSDVAHNLLDYYYTLPESKRGNVSKEILDFYLGQGESIDKEHFKQFTQVFTDRYFGLPGELAAKMQSKVTKSPVYYYLFNYTDGENTLKDILGMPSEIKGVCHSDDMFYLYGFIGQKPFSEQDKRLKEAFHNMLYSYVTTNKPSFDGTDIWQPTSPTELTYLNISGPGNMKIDKAEDLTHYDFWSKLGLREYENSIVENA